MFRDRLILSPLGNLSLGGEQLEVTFFPGSVSDRMDNFTEEPVTWTFTVAEEVSLAAAADEDTDGDRITNDLDNCSLAANPDQSDIDGME